MGYSRRLRGGEIPNYAFWPRNPKFNISSATLNATTFLDMRYLLNADLTLLANFTNPNNKGKAEFHYAIVDLYHDKSPIASTYIQQFSMVNHEYKFEDVHLVTSQDNQLGTDDIPRQYLPSLEPLVHILHVDTKLHYFPSVGMKVTYPPRSRCYPQTIYGTLMIPLDYLLPSQVKLVTKSCARAKVLAAVVVEMGNLL
nr:NDR1/HIN1-like protein 26 [Ipomoea batatas]